jgi:hypothetical protein
MCTRRWTDLKRTLYHVNSDRWGFLATAAERFAALRGALAGNGPLSAPPDPASVGAPRGLA